jgi:transcription initiation factor TFIIH subunit 4
MTMNSSTSSLKCDNLVDYLSSLGNSLIDKLYRHSSSCLAVFRELPDLAKHYVMRLLFVEQPIPQSVVASWVQHMT